MKPMILFSISLGLAATLSLSVNAQPRRTLVCSTYPIHLLTRSITQGVDGVEVHRLIPADAGCPHDYVISPADMRMLMRADAIIVNGLGMDDFLRRPLAAANHTPPWIDTSAGMTDLIPIDKPKHHDHGHHHHHAHDHEHPKPYDHATAVEPVNPHLFASPRRAALLVKNLAEALSAFDPEYADAYAANARRTMDRLNALADDMQTASRAFQRRTIITEHDSFDYLAADLGLQIAAVIDGGHGQMPTASALRRLTRTIRDRDVAVIITEPQGGGHAAGVLARETGIGLVTLDPVAGGPPDADLDHYLSVMRTNLETLQRFLQ